MECHYFVLLWTAIAQVTVAENSTATVAAGNMTLNVAGNMTGTAAGNMTAAVAGNKMTTAVSDMTGETTDEEPVSKLKSTAAVLFDRIVLTSTLGNYDPRVVLQKAAISQDSNLVIEEGLKNDTFAERFVYLKRGGEVAIPCNRLRLNTTADSTSIKYKWTDQAGVDLVAKPREDAKVDRVWVDNKYHLCLTKVRPEDSGNYFCIIQTVIRKKFTYFTNEIHFLVYVEPDLGISFPFIFEAPNCNDKRNLLKLDEVRNSLCPRKPCLYIFDIECRTTPWFLNYKHMSKTVVIIMATKIPHPNYRAPHCSHDCIMSNKFDHIISDMQTLQRTIADMTNTPDLIYVKRETMDKRKLLFLCNPGFEVHRENCVPCLPGKYKNSYGAGVCKKCPLDHYQSRAAGNSCTPCGPNYATDAEGARQFTACYRKIRIVQYTIPFFIACGVVGGILLIMLALCLAKCSPRCVAWLNAKRQQKDHKEEEKPVTSNETLFEKFLDLAAHAITARDTAIANSGLATVQDGIAYQAPQPIAYQGPVNDQKQPPAILQSATGTISPFPSGGERVTEVLVPPGVKASKLTLGSDNLSRVAQGTNRSKITLITNRSSLPESTVYSSRPTSQRDADSPRSGDATKISAAQTTVVGAGESPVLNIQTINQQAEKVIVDNESMVPASKIASKSTTAIKQSEKVIVDKELTVPGSNLASQNTSAIKQSEKAIVDKELTVPASKIDSQNTSTIKPPEKAIVDQESQVPGSNLASQNTSAIKQSEKAIVDPESPVPGSRLASQSQNISAIKQLEKVNVDKDSTVPASKIESPFVPEQSTENKNFNRNLGSFYDFQNYPPIFPYPLFSYSTPQIVNLSPISHDQSTAQNNNNQQQYYAEIVVYPKNAKKRLSKTQFVREAAAGLNSKTAVIPNMSRSSLSSIVQKIVGTNSEWTGVLVNDLPPSYRSHHSHRPHHSHRRSKKKSH